ncbi:YncE family protein [Granulicella arctica]|uniref:YncE family protein n=1 Tax=Granulicella arctica TaxID=940613 RepID=UPI0021E0F38A|nr:YncE family protein [Granulicella arctica]
MLGTSYAVGAATPTQPGGFQTETRWHLGGTGGWGKMVLDPAANQLFIPRSDRVDIVDTDSGKVSGQVSGFIGAHDIALDKSGKFGYVSDLADGRAGFVRVFDRTTLQILASIPVGRTPDRIAFDASTNTVFVFDGSAHNATVIDGSTNKAVETIALPARPGSIVSDGNGSIFVAIRSLSEILRIDASTRKITAVWPLAPCDGPSGLTMDKTRRQIFATCENQKLVAVDAGSGVTSLISEIPKGAGDVSFDSQRHLLFVSNGAGILTILRERSLNHFVKLQELAILPGAQSLTVNSTDGEAYVATAEFGQRTGATSEELRYRPTPVDGSFTVLVVRSHSKPHSSVSTSKK